MRSFRINKIGSRRATFLNLVGQVGSQLRDAYTRRYEQRLENQASLAKKLDVNRSAINRRLSGRTNMTLQTLADLVWSLGYAIKIIIYDPKETHGENYFPAVLMDQPSTALQTFSAFPSQLPSPVATPTPA